jgi:hypothetical protein
MHHRQNHLESSYSFPAQYIPPLVCVFSSHSLPSLVPITIFSLFSMF